MTDTTAERARKYRAAQKERGLVEMRIWLPPALHEPVRDMAEKMRKDWEDDVEKK